MNLQTRVDLYNQLEDERKHPLIVYVTSQRNGAPGFMSADTPDELIDQIECISSSEKEIDLLIESKGGDGLVAWRVISFLRDRFNKVNIIVPHAAYSAATMLALGGDTILMGKYGILGPTDPQIQLVQKDGTIQNFGYEDITAFLEFVKKDAGLTEQAHIDSAFKTLCGNVEPLVLGGASRASSLSISIGEKLLLMHMTEPEQKAKAAEISRKLNKNFFSHGHSLDRKEARDIGLKIEIPKPKVEDIIWKIHQSFEKELEGRKPFNPISEFLSDPGAGAYTASPPPITIPPQLNQQMVMQVIEQYIQAQMNATTPNVIREIKHAFVESNRLATVFIAKYKIICMRTADMKFMGNCIKLDEYWKNIEIPKIEKSDTVK